MKKSLLFLASGLSVLGATAQKPASPGIIDNVTVQAVSPDGKYMVSNPYEQLSIINLQTGERWDYYNVDQTTGMETNDYRSGNGNVFSNTGILLASTLPATNAAYWKGGEWFDLDSEGCIGSALANGITPDGSRICGSMSLRLEGFTTETMLLPVYWDAEGDGFGKYHVLPCPEKDFTGRAPQYITANSISYDGKTIAGQVHDYSGSVEEPIVYTMNDDGSWSYSLPMESVFRPEGLTWPAYPEDLPAAPTPTDYMSDEELLAYNQAMIDWAAGGYQEDEYPKPGNYMTADEIEAYNSASDEYNALAVKFNEELNKFTEVWNRVVADIPAFMYNNCYITPDGTKIAGTITVPENPDDIYSAINNKPVRIDVATGEYEIIGDVKSATVWSVLSDGRITAGSPAMDLNLQGYIEKEDGSLVGIYDYINELRPDYGAWMKENMTHMVETDYDFETGEFITEKMFIPGAALANADASIILTWTSNTWDYDTPSNYFGYFFDMNAQSGVGNISVSDTDAEVEVYEVYDVNGRMVFKTADNSAIRNAGLTSGIYVVKSVMTDGSATAAKIVL